MEVVIKRDYEQMSKTAAQIVVDVLNTKPNAVLGMATGSTPLGLYQELVRLHKAGGVDFSRVTTFNLDEYVGLPPNHPQSYHYFMHEHFFQHVRATTSTSRPARRVTIPRSALGTRGASRSAAGSTCRFSGSAPTGTSLSTSRGARSARARGSRRSRR